MNGVGVVCEYFIFQLVCKPTNSEVKFGGWAQKERVMRFARGNVLTLFGGDSSPPPPGSPRTRYCTGGGVPPPQTTGGPDPRHPGYRTLTPPPSPAAETRPACPTANPPPAAIRWQPRQPSLTPSALPLSIHLFQVLQASRWGEGSAASPIYQPQVIGPTRGGGVLQAQLASLFFCCVQPNVFFTGHQFFSFKSAQNGKEKSFF